MFFGFGRGAGQPGRQYTRVVTTPTKKRPAKRASRLWIAFTQAAFSRSMPGIYSGTDEELAVFGHGSLRGFKERAVPAGRGSPRDRPRARRRVRCGLRSESAPRERARRERERATPTPRRRA